MSPSMPPLLLGLLSLVVFLAGAALGALVVVWRTPRALRRQRARLNHQWEQRLAQAAIAQAETSERHLEDVTERERKRIAADLHDDLGAKLLTIVHTSEDERIAGLAREALEAMRLSVRGLTGKPMQLADALGDWRAEGVARLMQAHIEPDWAPLLDECPQTLPARSYVQATRVLREAISNVIKHSGAERCQVRCAIAPTHLELLIQDDGQGFDAASSAPHRGHGLASMLSRAQQIAGDCEIHSQPGKGTQVRLSVPL
ncbi:sensor histidine kinase [Inhella gelatinilytica]|nr:ATP-binding protein [Inhella gelatinilytica]